MKGKVALAVLVVMRESAPRAMPESSSMQRVRASFVKSARMDLNKWAAASAGETLSLPFVPWAFGAPWASPPRAPPVDSVINRSNTRRLVVARAEKVTPAREALEVVRNAA